MILKINKNINEVIEEGMRGKEWVNSKEDSRIELKET